MASPTINRPSSTPQPLPIDDSASLGAETLAQKPGDDNKADATRGDAQRAYGKKAEEQAKFHARSDKKAESQTKNAEAENKGDVSLKKGIAEVIGKDAVATANERPTMAPELQAKQFSLEEAPPQDKLTWAAAFDKLTTLLPDAPPANIGEQFSVDHLRQLALPAISGLEHAPSLQIARALESLESAPMFKSPASEFEAAMRDKASANSAKGERPTLTEAKFNRTNHAIKTLQAYHKLVQQFYSGALNAKVPQAAQLLAKLPPDAQKLFAQGSDKIAEAYKHYAGFATRSFKLEEDWDAPAGDHIPQIPGPAILLMEQGAQHISSAIRKSGAKVSMDLENGGPSIGNSGAEDFGADISDKNAGLGDVSFPINWDGVDIDCLMIMVMMNATKTEGDLLTDKLKEMDAVNRQKKQLREMKTQMKQASAKLEGQMLNEFNQLKGSGGIHVSIKFEDYKAWRQVQWADPQTSLAEDGTHDFSFPPTMSSLQQPSPPVDIPSWMVTGNTEEAKNAVAKGGDIFSQAGLPRTMKATLQKVFDGLSAEEKKTYVDLAGFMQSLGLIIPPESKDDIVTNLNCVKQAVTDAAAKADRARGNAGAGALKWSDLKVGGKMSRLAEEIAVFQALAKAGVDGAKEKADSASLQLKKLLGKDFPGGTCPADGPFPGMAFPDAVNQLMQNTAKVLGTGMTIVKAVLDGIAGGAPGSAEGLGERTGNNINKAITDALAASPYAGLLGDLADKGAASGIPGAAWLTEKFGGAGNGFIGGFKAGWNVEGKTNALFIGGFVMGVLGSIGGFIGGLFGGTDVSCDGVSVGFGPSGVNGSLTMWYDEPWPSENHHETAGIPNQDMSGIPGAGAVQSALGELGAGNLSSEQLGKMLKSFSSFDDDFQCTGKEAGAIDKDGHTLNTVDDFDDALEDIDHIESQLKDPNSNLSKVIDHRFKPKEDTTKQDQAKAAQAYEHVYAENGAGGFLQNQGNLAEMEASTQHIDDQLQSMSEMSEIDSLHLQTMMERRSKFIETLSNLLKKIDSTQETITQNLK